MAARILILTRSIEAAESNYRTCARSSPTACTVRRSFAARVIATANGFFGNIVSAEANSLGDTLNGKIRTGQPKKDQMQLVAAEDETPDLRCERPAGKRRLESETLPLARELSESLKHGAAGSDRVALGWRL